MAWAASVFAAVCFARSAASQDGVASGVDMDDPRKSYGWSRYRYTRYNATPQAVDTEHAMLAGGDIKCEVCEVILSDVVRELRKADKFNDKTGIDMILEALEAETIDDHKVDNAATEMERAVEKNKKGCNRHFKDRYFAKGWSVEQCHKTYTIQKNAKPSLADEDVNVPAACSKHTGYIPNTTEMNTYTVPAESVHFACQSTIGHYRDDIAEALVAIAANPSAPALVSDACRKQGKCLKRKKSESLEQRAKLLQQRKEEHDIKADKAADAIINKFKREQREQKKRDAEQKPNDARKDELEL